MNTPTPLKLKGTTFSNRNAVYNGNERLFVIEDYVYSNEMALERAAEIVTAVNYHDRLVDMVEQLRADLKAARSALYIVGRLQEAQINSKSIQYSEQLLTEIKESNGK